MSGEYMEIEDEYRTVTREDGSVGIIPSLNSVMRSCDESGVIDMEYTATPERLARDNDMLMLRRSNDAMLIAQLVGEKAALQRCIDTMLIVIESIRMEYMDDPYGIPAIEISRYGLSKLLDSIKYAGGGQ